MTRYALAAVLAAHGVIHLIGFVVVGAAEAAWLARPVPFTGGGIVTTKMDARSNAGTGRNLGSRHDRAVAAAICRPPPGARRSANGWRPRRAARPRPPLHRALRGDRAASPAEHARGLDANMYRNPGEHAMRARSVQYTFFASPPGCSS